MSSNLYISPATSFAGSENLSPVNLKPTLNETLMNKRSSIRKKFPNGTFSRRNNRNTLNSRQWGNTPFFTNAKPASMLERGWVRSVHRLKLGLKGLYTEKDGPEIEVEVINVTDKPRARRGCIYSFKNSSGGLISADDDNRFEEWDFYTATNPVPFVPKKGGKKTRRLRRKA